MNTQRLTFALLGALVLLLAPHAALGDDHDRWYVVKMQGQRAGWMHTSRATADGRVTTAAETRLKIKRGAAAIEIRMTSEFVETADGRPVSALTEMTMASQPTVARYTFENGRARVSRSAAGRAEPVVTEEDLPEGPWLTPAAAETFGRKRLEAGAPEFTVRALDVSQGLRVVTTTTRVVERLNVEGLGRKVPGVKLLSTSDAAPGIDTVTFADERGAMVRSETNLGGIVMEMILADRDLAQAEVDAPELMESTLVVPRGRIDSPRTVRKATYLLRLRDKDLADIPSGGAQRVERVDANTLRVRIDADDVAPAPEGDDARAEYRRPSQMIESEDEVVARLTRDALKGVKEGDHEARVEALRLAVFRHIRNKGFGVGFASAAEVARTCEGDCSEHAALLTAMLRNAGYAARTASGLVLVEEFAGKSGVFGYHMWTQVLLERDGAKRWIDLDATLPGGRGYGRNGFDATHIVLATASLKDGDTVNELVALAPLIGALEIVVE